MIGRLAGHLARGVALAWLLPLLMLPVGGRAYGDGPAEPAPIDPTRRVAPDPPDQLFFLGGSDRAWSVSNTSLGCLLLSPARTRGMRTALGRHATYGQGLFLIGLSLAVHPDSPGEPVVLSAGGRDLAENGRVVARDVFFVALSRSDIAAALHELSSAGTVWVTVRQTALTQGGDAVKQAVEDYGRECAPVR
jgi:hypothetical protein